MPAHSPYKIYIIDEVHMLSTPAFNALLKTLEEPPAHVMFLFATTEPAKIPITILSRCQRHDLRRIDIEAVCGQMEMICNQEGVKITKESLLQIAREGGGSMRDALSLLDQLIACTSGEVTHERVLEILGAVDRSVIFQCSQAILQGDLVASLTVLDDIYGRGLDMRKLYDDLTEHFRDLLIVKVGQQVNRLVDLPAHEIKMMQELSASVSALHLSQLFDLLFKEEAVIRYASQPKLALEIVLIRMSHLAPALPIDTLIEKLDLLRNEIKGTQGVPDAIGSNGSIGSTNAGYSPNSHLAVKAPLSQYNASATPPPPVADRQVKETKPVEASPVVTDDMPAEQVWRKITQLVEQRHPGLSAHLSGSSIAVIKDDRLEIEIGANAFTAKMMQRDKNKSDLKKVCDEVFGKNMEIIIKGNDKSQRKQKQPQKQLKNQTDRLHEEALSHPLVMEAVHIFNGQITKVNIL